VGEKSLFSSEFLFIQSFGTNQTQCLIGLSFYQHSLPWLPDMLLFMVVQRDDLFFLEKIGSTCEEMFPVVQGGSADSQHVDLEIYLQRGLCYTRMDNEETACHEFDLYLMKAIEQAGTTPERLADYYYTRGNTYEQLRQFENALQDYEKASELAERADIYHRLAWLLATCSESTIRDGERALHYATLLCEYSNYNNGQHLDILAASYAAVGKFQEAVKWEQTAIELMSETNAKAIFTERLQLYLSKQPYIQED
jgi:tetratricopeptide (TPR) repeat protein